VRPESLVVYALVHSLQSSSRQLFYFRAILTPQATAKLTKNVVLKEDSYGGNIRTV